MVASIKLVPNCVHLGNNAILKFENKSHQNHCHTNMQNHRIFYLKKYNSNQNKKQEKVSDLDLKSKTL